MQLEFTPLEFETRSILIIHFLFRIRIYSVGVWNSRQAIIAQFDIVLEFTPLEFETCIAWFVYLCYQLLEFTPLEFETCIAWFVYLCYQLLEFTPLEFETFWVILVGLVGGIRIYSVGVWNWVFKRGRAKAYIHIRIYSVGVWNMVTLK